MGLEREELRPYSIGRNSCSLAVRGFSLVDEYCYAPLLFRIHHFAVAPLAVQGLTLWNSSDPVIVVTIVTWLGLNFLSFVDFRLLKSRFVRHLILTNTRIALI